MDGILIINKEPGCTSSDVVKRVKKILQCNKVGHTGTLDPNATGVLPLLLGNATKISQYITEHDKEYEALLQLGKKTTTADAEGEILEESVVNDELLKKEKVEHIFKSMIGKLQQIPPMYSAIKVSGKKLYEYARNGEKIEISPRTVKIFDIRLINIDMTNKQIKFYVKCSKGTYIRTLCEEIATRLGNIGYMQELNRISVGSFGIEESITIGELEKQVNSGKIKGIITIEEFFKNFQKNIFNTEAEWNKYCNGVSMQNKKLEDGICRIYYNEKFTGIGIVKKGIIKRRIVL